MGASKSFEKAKEKDQLSVYSSSDGILIRDIKHSFPFFTFNRAPVAQLVEHQAVTREVVSSTPAGPTLRVFKKLRRKCCLCNYICKWLDSLVFSDKGDKPEVPSHNPSMFIILWDVKEPAHLS